MSTTTTQLEAVEAIELTHPIRQQQPLKSSAPATARAPTPEDDATAGDQNGAGGLSKADVLRLTGAGFSFFVAGVNDGSIGALIPYIIRQHEVDTATASAIYAANFAGWLTAAFANTHLSQYLDLGAMLALGAVCQVIAQALRAWDPPFGLFVATFWVVSVGQAFQDTHANTFVAGVRGAHRWLAFIHAMYMAGCLVAPFAATGVASVGEIAQSRWYLFYLFPLGLGIANIVWSAIAFRDTLRLRGGGREKRHGGGEDSGPREQQHEEPGVSRSKDANSLVAATLKDKNVWLVSLFFFFYLGAVLTASGWVVEYLVEVRNGNLSQMGYVPAGFNGGCLLGRLLLAEPTHRFGERRMVALYCVLALSLQLVFWLVPNIIAASIAISFIGFFTGPLFATGISLGSKLFPARIHSTALSLVFVVAQMGGCAFPVITGVVAANAGVATLQPILVGLLVATGISWMLVPRPKSSANSELHQE